MLNRYKDVILLNEELLTSCHVRRATQEQAMASLKNLHTILQQAARLRGKRYKLSIINFFYLHAHSGIPRGHLVFKKLPFFDCVASLPRVRIEPTICGAYSRTLVPLRLDCGQLPLWFKFKYKDNFHMNYEIYILLLLFL